MERKCKKSIRNILYCFCILCLIIGCNTPKDKSRCNTVVNISDTIIVKEYVFVKDSLIYELPEKTTNAILKMIANKKVSRCGLLRYSFNEYSFSFDYDNITLFTKHDSLLFEKTSTYLKLKDKFLPVISEFDERFFNVIDSSYVINDFNYCYVRVDARGNLLSSFDYYDVSDSEKQKRIKQAAVYHMEQNGY